MISASFRKVLSVPFLAPCASQGKIHLELRSRFFQQCLAAGFVAIAGDRTSLVEKTITIHVRNHEAVTLTFCPAKITDSLSYQS